MQDFPALPSYLTGDGSAPAPPSQPTGLPPLPSYLGGPQPPPAQTASASTSQDPNADQLMQLARAHGKPQLGDYLARQGAPREAGPVASSTGSWWNTAKAAASNAFGMPLAGAAETYRDWTQKHPELAAIASLLVPGAAAAHHIAEGTPQGLTEQLKNLSEEQRQAFLAAHPGTGGAAAEYATELGVNLLPMLAGAPAAVRSLAAGRTGIGGVASLATAGKGALVGAGVGAPMGYAGSYGGTPAERAWAAGQGALLMGGMGGLGALAARPTLPSYLTGERPLPDGGAFRLPREAPQQAPGAPISPGPAPTPGPAEVTPPMAAGPGGRLGVPTRMDPAELAANRSAGPAPTETRSTGAFGHVQVEAPGDEAAAALAAHVQAAAHEVAPGRAIHDGDAVLLGANDEAGLLHAAAATQERLAAHPVVVTHLDGTTYEHPIQLMPANAPLTPQELARVKPGMEVVPGMEDAQREAWARQDAEMPVHQRLAGMTTDQLYDQLAASKAYEKAHPDDYYSLDPPPADMVAMHLSPRRFIGGDTPQELGASLRGVLGDLTAGSDRGLGVREAAQGAVREAGRYARESGWDPAEVGNHALAAYGERFRDPNDRAFMMQQLRDATSPVAAGAAHVPHLPAGPNAFAERVLAAEGLPAAAHEPGAGGPSGAAGPPPGAAPAGLHDALQGAAPLAGAAGRGLPGEAGGGPLPGQALGQAVAGAAELQAAGHGAQGTGAAGAEAAQLEGGPPTQGPAAAGTEAAAPPPHGGGAEGQALAQLQSGEAGFVKNPMNPTPAEQGWRQFFPLRRSFVNQENADRLAAQLHETDLMQQFPDKNLRRVMSLAVERNDPMQAPAEEFVRAHPHGGDAAMAEVERQRAQGLVNMKGLRDLGFVPKDTPDVQDYIRHEWEPIAGAPTKPYSSSPSHESPNTSILQERAFPTLGTGIRAGRTPTTLDYATMVRNGDEEFSHTLALHRLMQDVSEVRFMGDGNPAYLRMTSKNADELKVLGYGGYRDVSGIPLLNRAIPGEGTLYMHKNLWDNISPIIRDSPTTPIGKETDTALSTAKQMLLGFSFFHPAELTIQNALQRGVTPALWEGLKRGFGVPGLNQLTQKMGWGNLERETWMQAAKEGVNYTSPETDTNMIQAQKTLASLANRMGLTEDTAGGKAVKVVGKILASPHEAMFPGYMAPLKVMVQTINRDKLLRLRNGDDFAMGALGYLNRKSIRALSDDDAIAGVTNNTNNAFGGQSTRLFVNRLASDPMAQKVLSRMFLAPDWFTSGSKLMAEPLSPNPVTRTLGMQMYGRLALQTFVGLNLANYALTRAFSPTGRGHFMIDNEPGKETQLQTGPNEFMNVMKLQRELPDVVGKERVSNAIGAFAHAGPQGAALEWLRQPHGPWPGADEPVATSRFRFTDPSWRETPVLSTLGNKVNPLPNAAFGELSGHYLSGYPTDLTKAQEKAQQRSTFEMPKAEWQYRLQTALRPFAPIPGSKLADTDQPLTAGEVTKQLAVPFQLSKGLNLFTARSLLADAFRKDDQRTVSEITAILMSHIDRRNPEQAATDEVKVYKTLARAQYEAQHQPTPLTTSGKPEAPLGTPWISPP